LAKLKIHTLGSRVLTQKAGKVEVFDRQLASLAEEMMETLMDAPGVGLSAPQVGKSIRMIVVAFPVEGALMDGEGKHSCIINPRLVLAGERVAMEEGCLSIPGVEGEVERFMLCEVRGKNLQGEDIFDSFSDLPARILQHECDHLDGILYVQHLSRLAKARLSPKLRELRKQWSEQD